MALIEKLKNIANAIRAKTNKTEELTLEQMASAILNIKSITNLQDKQVTITENGTQTITADEGFDGLSSVEVNANVHGTGFSVLDGGEFQEEFNSLIAQKVTASNLASSQAEGNITYKFRDNTDIIYVVSDKKVQGQSAFTGCTELIWLKLNIGSVGLKWGIPSSNNIRNLDFTFPRNTVISGLLMNLSKAKKNNNKWTK